MAETFYGYVFKDDSKQSVDIVERDLRSISSSYTRSYGFVMSHGRGAEAWDVDENRYVDFASGIAVLATGYSHPRIVKAIKEQAERFIHIGGTDFFYREQVLLAEKLQGVIPIHNAPDPGDKRVYMCNSGTEAVEAALKLARYRRERSQVIAFYGGFHGRTMGSLSVTASKAVQRENYPFIPGGVVHIPYPARNPDGTRKDDGLTPDPIQFLEKVVFKKKVAPKEVAAIIVESIQGEGGYLVPEDTFLPRLRELCDRHGILLIADEIQSGMGRTGTWLAMEHWGVYPDIVCLAKGLGSGIPIGAVVAHRDVMQNWVSGAHASTFGGNALACEVARTTIEIIEDEGLLEHVRRLGEHTMRRLKAMQARFRSITRVDGKGLMIGIDFSDAGGRPLPAFRDRVVDECFLGGLITLGCGTGGLRIAPPLVITQALMDEGLDLLEAVIARLEETEWQALATAPQPGARVLVVDDDAERTERIRSRLAALPGRCAVSSAPDHDRGMLMLGSGVVYDVVILNTSMAGGLDLLPMVNRMMDYHGALGIGLVDRLEAGTLRAILRQGPLNDIIVRDDPEALEHIAALVTADMK